LKQGAAAARACYDAARVNKGPSLGTDFSLLCPFTLLAHYQELAWAESCGVSPWLLRLSVGLEEVETLWQGLLAGLSATS
jgi:cystathionine gamma-synthase